MRPNIKSIFRSSSGDNVQLLRTALWVGVTLAIVLGMIWDRYPLSDARERLAAIPICGPQFNGRNERLTEGEKAVLGKAVLVHRRYSFRNRRFFLTVIDGTQNRHAVHDPRYCFQGMGWRITENRRLPISGGEANWFRIERAGRQGEVIYWFSDGKSRHASFLKYWCWTTLRRLTMGRCGEAPILAVVQSYKNQPPHCSSFVDELIAALQL